MALSRGSKVFAVLLVVLIGGGLWGINTGLERLVGGSLPEPVEPGLAVDFEISAGQSASGVAANLDDQGVVSATDFIDEVNRRDIAGSIAPGNYELETGMEVAAVVDVIQAGPSLLRITVAEGLRVDQTLSRLADQTTFDGIDFQDVLDDQLARPEEGPLTVPGWVPPLADLAENERAFEGLLFPLTYDFSLDATPTEILQRLIDQTDSVMEAIPSEQVAAAEAAGISRYEALIIASLIEREAQVEQDRPLIAAVIRNRLDDEMILQIDAAREYAREEFGNPEGSPYNLYEVEGLPPTPISGARAQALQVTFNPASVTFRFYVLSDACDGTHVFADTGEEHDANVAAWRDAGECGEA